MREAGGVTALAARPAPLPAAAARHRSAADPAHLQLREALAGLASPDLQQQSVFAAEALLTGADATFCDWAVREALRTAELGTAPATARRLRYRLAARALAARPSGADWGNVLVLVRDCLVSSCSAEDHAPAAAQMAALAHQLAASCIDAYCRGCYASLGFSAAASKADLPRDWLSQLLLQPLLRGACRGPARTLVANACLLVHAVLRELGGGRWAKSAGVLHAAVDCLKHALKLTGSGSLALCAGEALLPLQACVSLLGPRLKLAALEGILQICTRAMQRSEWAVRKAAADTLAQLAEILLAAGSSAATGAAGQQQGLAALEALAPDMAAAVEEHLKYDRIPQVRQAAAAALQLLGRVPGMQAQQAAAPAGPAQPAPRPISAAGQAPAGPAAAAAPRGVAPAGGLSQARSNLQAVIAERRRQLQDAGWHPGGPAEVQVYGGQKAAAAGMAACRASSSGSAEEAEDGTWNGDRIRAWAGEMGKEEQEAQHEAAAETGDAAHEHAAPRPPSAAAFQTAAEALQWLDGEPAQQAAKKRRGWSSRAASPAKQGVRDAAAGGHDVPVQIYAPPAPSAQPQQQQQLWRENPLAASAEAPGQAALGHVPVAAAAVPCTHHVQHPQFSLRLQAAPPEAQLCLAAADMQQAAGVVQSVRFWAGSSGADVGIEFGLASDPGSTPTRHRFWLREGQLLQEQHSAAAPAASPPRAAPAAVQVAEPPPPAPAATVTEAAADAGAMQASSSAGQHTPQPNAHVEQQRQQQKNEGHPPEPAAEQVPFESPLASLATAALPSFSPEKQPAAQRPASGSPQLATTPRAAAVGWAQPGGSPRASPLARSPAGQRRSSPDNQQHLSTVRWAASLRPPGEQRLPGLPDWDRSRPESPLCGVGGITHGAEGGSRPGSRAGSRAGSRPGSRASSRAGSRPGSPTRGPQLKSPGGGRPVSPGPAAAAVPAPAHQQEAEPAHGGKAAGPLTVMVRRAVSKLQQLHELEEELQLPAAGIQPSSSAPQLSGASAGARQHDQQPARYAQQPQQRQPPPQHELRRSLEPVLSAIKEAHSEEGSQGASGHSSSRWGGGRQVSDGRSSGSPRSGASSAAQQQEAGRLQRLQDQLAANMQQIQRRLDGQQEAHSARSPRSPAGGASPAGADLDTCERGSSGESGMPAAWDEQEALPAPGQRRYAPQHAAQQEQQAASAPRSPASSCGDAEPAGGYQDAHAPGSGSSGVVMAVSNPLFGSSRPGTADGMQSMQDALLPPKRSLRRQRSSQDESGSPHLTGQQQHSVGMGGSLLQASLGSLGSGFGVLHRESEAEVQQFLRGSLAAPRQQQQQQQHKIQQQPRQPLAAAAVPAPAPAPAAVSGMATRSRGSGSPASQSAGSAASSHLLPSGRSESHTPAAAAGGQAVADPRWVGSIDLGAILGESRPPSPGKSPLLQLAEQLAAGDSSSEGDGEQPWMTARSGGGWHTARSGPAPGGWRAAHNGGSGGGSAGWPARAAAAGWLSSSEEGSESGAEAFHQQLGEQQGGDTQAAVAELQLLRISSRSPSPPRQGHGSGSHGRAGSASLSDVVQQTFPSEAVERLERLREQLSPDRQQQAASPLQGACHSGRRRSMSSSGQHAVEDAAAASGAAGSEAASGSRGSGRAGSSRQGSPTQQLPKRCDSPELPGLHITLHQAKLLQSAVGRMPGNPGESADAAAIQEALMDVLAGWTLHVQKHYQRAAAEQLAATRRRHGGDAAAALREGRRLEAAREAAVRDELSLFVEQTLPRLAEVLSSRELLLRCFEAAADQDEEA